MSALSLPSFSVFAQLVHSSGPRHPKRYVTVLLFGFPNVFIFPASNICNESQSEHGYSSCCAAGDVCLEFPFCHLHTNKMAHLGITSAAVLIPAYQTPLA